jgi:hypothetical protein
MRKVKLLTALVLLIGIMVFFAGDKSYAACDPALGTKCGDFGSNTIIFVSSTSDTCNLSTGTVACTRYNYTYTGSPTTIEVLIPKSVQTRFTAAEDAAAAGCSSLNVDGTGDPANGFGVNIVTHNLCKVQLSSNTFSIFADLSRPKAISWQEIVNKSITIDTLDGPAIPAAAVEETAATLTTSEGVSVSYTNVEGQITITGGSARKVPLSGTKLCIVKPGGDPTVPYTSSLFASNWTCETITFATEQCDIKTAGTDPCRFIGGTCISY